MSKFVKGEARGSEGNSSHMAPTETVSNLYKDAYGGGPRDRQMFHAPGGGSPELLNNGRPIDSGWIYGGPVKGCFPDRGGGFEHQPVPPKLTEIELCNPYITYARTSSDRTEMVKDVITTALSPIPPLAHLTRSALDVIF